MRLSVISTTGSAIELVVPRGETVEGLRTRLSQKLRIPRDRIVLLHEDRQLGSGSLLDLGVADGSRLTLVPAVESGLTQTSRADRTLIDVLESLTDSQVSDFLSGRSALTIKLGLGSSVLYVQLQLGAQNATESHQNQDCSSSGHDPVCLKPSTPTSSTSPPSPAWSASPMHLGSQRPGLSSAIRHDSRSPHPLHPARGEYTHSAAPSPLLPGFPHRSFPNPATPVSAASPGPPSPAPASTFKEMASSVELCRQPGAVIESFVSHSPGLFSGTFSGTLAPCSQSSVAHPRRGITIILQILTDLLRATFPQQGAPPVASPPHRSATESVVGQLFKAETSGRAIPDPPETQSVQSLDLDGIGDELGPETPEENQTLHSKLQHLHFLMHQRRLRRQFRSGLQPSQRSRPYQRLQQRPPRPPTGRQRNSSVSSSPKEASEEPPWNPEVNSDFVVA